MADDLGRVDELLTTLQDINVVLSQSHLDPAVRKGSTVKAFLHIPTSPGLWSSPLRGGGVGTRGLVGQCRCETKKLPASDQVVVEKAE